MPSLQEAYERFRERDFTILSLSFDSRPENVGSCRQGQWKMPWPSAWVAGMYKSKLAAAFSVRGIPKPILVGSDGTILEGGSNLPLRGEELLVTLDKLLPPASQGERDSGPR